MLVYEQLYNFLENNNILNVDQFGFRRGRYTVDALNSLVRQLIIGYEDTVFAQATLCWAFDCLDGKRLIIMGFKDEDLGFVNPIETTEGK